MGYKNLSGFSAFSRDDVADALKKLRERGAKWVVLDLRGNGGGVFEGALEICAFFVGDNVPMVDVYGRKPQTSTSMTESFKTHLFDTNAQWSADLAILLSPYSASSSEVLAAGLHEKCAAAVVGDKSFGKGVIQGVFRLPDGEGLVVAVAEYRTLNGLLIDVVGVTPDFQLHYGFLDKTLKLIGIDRKNEHAFILSYEDVASTLRICRDEAQLAELAR